MKLTFEARNICGSVSDFVLLGMEPVGPVAAIEEHDHDGGRWLAIPIMADLHVEQWHTVITIRSASVEPGALVRQEAEMEYDPRALRWVTPDDARGRFMLLSFEWGGHTLIKRPGAV